jgi:serine/threonine protein kinase
MEKYQIIEVLGDGTFGVVSKAKDLETQEIVAVKKFKKKYHTWDECKNLREVKSLVNFECLDKNLYELIKARQGKKLSEPQIRCIIWQILNGIEYMHKYGFFHRDLKPENLLVSGDKVKIADFGLAREIRSVPPYTEYVATRWYRAPECALKSQSYNSPVDIWAIGTIMAELYTFKPLFPGTNEKDLLFKMCSVLGPPTQASWAEGIQLAKKINFQFSSFAGNSLETLIPDASKEAIDMMTNMLSWDPSCRPTAQKLLQHPFFQNFPVTYRITTPEKKQSSKEVSHVQRRKSIVLMNTSKNNFAGDLNVKKMNSKDIKNNSISQNPTDTELDSSINIDKSFFSQIKQKEQSELQCKLFFLNITLDMKINIEERHNLKSNSMIIVK